eukprot:14797817-Alexandrium_andersonii.AAC.1
MLEIITAEAANAITTVHATEPLNIARCSRKAPRAGATLTKMANEALHVRSWPKRQLQPLRHASPG